MDATFASPEVTFTIFPCGNEKVNIVGDETTSLDLDMNDPVPAATVYDYSTYFESNRTGCPVTTFTLEMANNASLTEEESEMFSIDTEAQELSILPLVKDNHKLYLRAETAEG